MVAINLTRLNKELDALLQKYDSPQAFHKQLHHFLSFYHQYAHRQHKDSIPESFMRQYNLPKQIMPQLELTLRTKAHTSPEESFALIEELWNDEYFEARDLACFLLGQQKTEHASKVMAIVEDWLSQPQDRAVVASIFDKAIVGVLNTTPEMVSQLIKSLLSSKEIRRQNWGLIALNVFLPKASSNDLPMVYNLIRPFIAQSDLMVQARLTDLVEALAKRSPGEMAYLLKEVLADTEGAEIEQRLRRYLDFFEDDFSESIHAAIKAHAKVRLKPFSDG